MPQTATTAAGRARAHEGQSRASGLGMPRVPVWPRGQQREDSRCWEEFSQQTNTKLSVKAEEIIKHGLEIVMAVAQGFEAVRELMGKRITARIALPDDPGGGIAGRLPL